MKLEYAFCAKFADVGLDGLMSAIGVGLDSLNTAQFPAVVSGMAVAGCVTVPLEEVEGDHKMRIELFGPSGDKHPLELEFPVVVQRVEGVTRPPRWSFAVTLQNVVFGVQGRHEFRLLIDGRQIGSVALHVDRQAASQGGQT